MVHINIQYNIGVYCIQLYSFYNCLCCRFVVGIGIYFIAGALILKFKYNKTGYDIIPQRQFWFSLPGLIKVREKNKLCLKNESMD